MISDQDFQNLKNELEELKTLLYKDNFSALQIIRKQQELADGINLELGSSDGTKIGTGILQKLAFWNITPIIQQETITAPSGGATVDQPARDSINEIKAFLTLIGLTK